MYVNAELIAIIAATIALGTAVLASIRGVRQEVRDVRNEVQDVRNDVRDLRNEVRDDMKGLEAGLRDEMQAGFKELTARIVNLGDRLSKVEGIIEGLFWGARNQPADKAGEGAA